MRDAGGPDEITAVVFTLGGKLVVNFKGALRTGAITRFDGALAKLHAAVIEQGLKEVTIDLRELDALTPRSFKTLVAWITSISQVADPYRVRFLRNPERPWQARTIDSLACFAPSLVTSIELAPGHAS